jgi:hypothetical protein
VHVWWQTTKQKGERIVDWLDCNEMMVVEDEHNAAGKSGDLVDQGSEDRLSRRRLRALKRTQRTFSDIGLNRL